MLGQLISGESISDILQLPAHTWYLLDSSSGGTPAGGSYAFPALQDGGTPPVYANFVSYQSVLSGSSSNGWTQLLAYGNTGVSNFSATVYPNTSTKPGTYADFGADYFADSFVTPAAYAETYTAGNWLFSFEISAYDENAAYEVDGSLTLGMLVWASTDKNGISPAPRLLSPSVITFTTASAFYLRTPITATWNAPVVALSGEYLFFQLAWQIVTHSVGANPYVQLNVDGANSYIVATPLGKPYKTFSSSLAGAALLADSFNAKRVLMYTSASAAIMAAAFNAKRVTALSATPKATVVDNLKTTRPLAGAVSGTASTVETVSVKRASVTASAGVATAAVTVVAKRAEVLAATPKATVADAFTAKRPLATPVAAAVAMVDTIVSTRRLSGAASGTSSTVSTAAVRRAIVDQVAGTSSIVDATRVKRAMIDSAAGAATLAETAAVKRAIVDATLGTAAVVDRLAAKRPLADIVSASATVTDKIAAKRPMAQSASGSASQSANQVVKRPLADTATGSASVTASASVSAAVALAMALHGQAYVVTAMASTAAVSCLTTGDSTFVSTQLMARALGSATHSTSTLAGLLGERLSMSSATVGSASVVQQLLLGRPFSIAVIGWATLAAGLGLKAKPASPVYLPYSTPVTIVSFNQVAAISPALLPSSPVTGVTMTASVISPALPASEADSTPTMIVVIVGE